MAISGKAPAEIGYRTVVRWLHDNNFRLKVPTLAGPPG